MAHHQPATSDESDPPSSTSASIDDLPEELLDQIVGYFHIHCDSLTSNRPDTLRRWRHTSSPVLQSLSLVSKRWRRVAEPHFYRAFYNQGSRRRTQLFIRTLIARPHLTKHVDIIYLDAWKPIEPVLPEGFPAEDDDWKPVAANVSRCHQLTSRFESIVDAGFLYANTVFLLALATHITLLDLDFWFDAEDSWIREGILKSSAVEQGPLHQLRRIVVGSRKCERSVNARFLYPLLYLPSLREIEAWDIEGIGSDEHFLSAGTSGVTSIALCDSIVSPQAVRPILASLKTLKSFTYRLALFWEPFNFHNLYNHLSLYRHSLEHICLDLREHDEFPWITPVVIPLRGFTSLTRLEISQCILVPSYYPASNDPWDGPAEYQERIMDLPPSLESLSVYSFYKYEYSRDLISFLRFLPPACSCCTPRLRQVDLRDTVARGISTREFVDLARETRKMLEEVNVRLLFHERR